MSALPRCLWNCHVGSTKYNDPDLHHGLGWGPRCCRVAAVWVWEVVCSSNRVGMQWGQGGNSCSGVWHWLLGGNGCGGGSVQLWWWRGSLCPHEGGGGDIDVIAIVLWFQTQSLSYLPISDIILIICATSSLLSYDIIPTSRLHHLILSLLIPHSSCTRMTSSYVMRCQPVSLVCPWQTHCTSI